MEEEHVSDLIPGYALGILDDPEKMLVDGHLEICQHCRAELESYQLVVEELPLAMKISQPPDRLKAGIFERVRADQRSKVEPEQISIWDRFRNIFTGRALVWGAVSIVVVLILSVSNLLLWQRVNRLSANQQELITVALHGTDVAPDAVGMLVMSNDGDYGVLVVDGLPNLTESQQYQLWLIEDGKRASGGVFSVNDEGYGSIVVSSQQPLINYEAFGITLEPSGGSPDPTGEKVLGGEL